MIKNFTRTNPTTVTFELGVSTADIESVKNSVVAEAKKKIKVPGFRPGHAPDAVVEQQIDQSFVQNEVIQRCLSQAYALALDEKSIREVAAPKLEMTKFVPYTTLEFKATVECIGELTLPKDYKKIAKSIKKSSVETTDTEVDESLNSLALRQASHKVVERIAEINDRIWIEFVGTDAKSGEAIKGADGKDYPLVLGSDTFIPGFEEGLIGVAAGDIRELELRFPKEYGVKSLQGKLVKFSVTVDKVEETTIPKIDDEFAKLTGGYQSVKELREEVSKYLQEAKQNKIDEERYAKIVEAITAKTEVEIPEVLIQDEISVMRTDMEQNAKYRGTSYQEMIEAQGKTVDSYEKDELNPVAISRIKAALVLETIATDSNIQVTQEELDSEITNMKATIKNPEALNDLQSRDGHLRVYSQMMNKRTLEYLATM
jgi:trigger factor